MAKDNSDLLNLSGRTAVVTGGAGGIGRAVCRALASAGGPRLRSFPLQ